MRCVCLIRCTVVVSAFLSVMTSNGCGGGGGTDGAQVAHTTSDGKKLSADDHAAADFVLNKIKEHWLKGSDGWTTRLQQYNMLGQVMPGDPEILFHQYREFKFAINPEQPSDSMKLNGTDYRAGITFEKSSRRTYRTEQTYEGPQGWSLWQDNWPSMTMAVERRNGQWIISDSDLWEGVLPNAADVPTGK